MRFPVDINDHFGLTLGGTETAHKSRRVHMVVDVTDVEIDNIDTCRFMGSYEWGDKYSNYSYKPYYGTYNIAITTHEPPSTSRDLGVDQNYGPLSVPRTVGNILQYRPQKGP